MPPWSILCILRSQHRWRNLLKTIRKSDRAAFKTRNARIDFAIAQPRSSRFGIALRAPMNVGDTVIFTIPLEQLKRQFPHSFVVVDGHRTFTREQLETNPFAQLLVGNPNIDLLVQRPKDFLKLACAPRIRYFYHLDLLMFQACKVGYWRTGSHEAEIFCDILGLDRPPSLRPRIYLNDTERTFGLEMLARLKGKNREVLLLHCDAINPLKRWPANKWAKTVKQLSKDFMVIQVGTDNAFAVEGAVNLIGKLSLRQLASLSEAAGRFLGVDSGVHHICYAMGCRSVVVAPSIYPKSLWAYPDEQVLIRTPNEIACAHCGQNNFGSTVWELQSIPQHMDRGVHCCTRPECIRSISHSEVYRACQKAFTARTEKAGNIFVQ